MARFIDLDNLDEPQDPARPNIATSQPSDNPLQATPAATDDGITKALACYPVAIAIASSIDLNTLDALARTSRGIHNDLIQYRTMLLQSTLRCRNDKPPASDNLSTAAKDDMKCSNIHDTSFRSCARDMVDECRRCGDVVCRNCAIKPPPPAVLHERHRRLCSTCAREPITNLVYPSLELALPMSSKVLQPAVCRCESRGTWLCRPCGRRTRSADNDYQRIWRWRTQYGELLGSLRADIGDGYHGVICGRESGCLAARDCEQEVDCDAEDARDSGTAPWISNPPPSASSSAHFINLDSQTRAIASSNHPSPSPQLGPGYGCHEIEGIGGKVKRKLVRRVSVGACVPELSDDMMPGSRILGPEVDGAARSWCGWCWRVIPGKQDLETLPPSLMWTND